MPVTINGTTGITTPDLDSTADISANSVAFGEGGGSISTNTAAGNGALVANTTGSNNTAIGYQAGNSHTTETNSTFVGYRAGYTGNGGQNTFVGYQAGLNSGGFGNTAIGYLSMQSVTGYQNGAFGRLALRNLTTGFDNTAVGGNNAGALITTGIGNTVVGHYDGNQGGLDIRTSNYNIVLADGNGSPRLHFDSSGNLNMTTTLTSSQAGVYTTNNVFSIGASTNVRVQVNIGNYGFVKFRIYGLRTNAGNSVVWWEGILNNNNNQSFTNTITQQTSGGNISFTLSSPSAGVWNFDFNNAGSGGTGWYDKQDYGSGSVTVTTY